MSISPQTVNLTVVIAPINALEIAVANAKNLFPEVKKSLSANAKKTACH